MSQAPARQKGNISPVRIAALGDTHLGVDSAGWLRTRLAALERDADVLLLAGDLTRYGTVAEARVVADELRDLAVPVVAVLGNHDYHDDEPKQVAETIATAGVTMLEGTSTHLQIGGRRVGISGVKGFGGGFAGRCATAFGEREMKEFVNLTEEAAARLGEALAGLDAEVRIALTHYSPVADTLQGECPEIYPFLGSYLLAEVIDAAHIDLAVHGHAHAGREKAVTPGGVPVRNVAQPVIGDPYTVYRL